MTHMQKPPPPGQGFLYGEASSQPTFAGSNTSDLYTFNRMKYHKNYLRQQGRSAVKRAVLCWRFCFGGYGQQYTWGRRVCQAVVSNVVNQVNNLESVAISHPFYLPAVV